MNDISAMQMDWKLDDWRRKTNGILERKYHL